MQHGAKFCGMAPGLWWVENVMNNESYLHNFHRQWGRKYRDVSLSFGWCACNVKLEIGKYDADSSLRTITGGNQVWLMRVLGILERSIHCKFVKVSLYRQILLFLGIVSPLRHSMLLSLAYPIKNLTHIFSYNFHNILIKNHQKFLLENDFLIQLLQKMRSLFGWSLDAFRWRMSSTSISKNKINREWFANQVIITKENIDGKKSIIADK